LRADPPHLQKILEEGDPENRINPIHITHYPEISPYTPYEYSKLSDVVSECLFDLFFAFFLICFLPSFFLSLFACLPLSHALSLS
jgi:hypothetical protein